MVTLNHQNPTELKSFIFTHTVNEEGEKRNVGLQRDSLVSLYVYYREI